MNFYETRMGARFFQGQLPQLINALTSIEKSLSAPKQAIQIHVDDYDTFLVELYHGNYDPSDVPATEEQTAYTSQIMMFQRKLRSDLPRETWDELVRYRSLLEDRHSLDRQQAFACGFRCAMTMLAAGLSLPTQHGDRHEHTAH